MGTFEQELESLLNRWNQEAGSDTPDFILARYIKNCLTAFDGAVNAREQWYERKPMSVSDVCPGTPDPESV